MEFFLGVAPLGLLVILAVWLVWHYGLRRVPVAHLALSAAIAGAAGAVVFWPYLTLEGVPPKAPTGSGSLGRSVLVQRILPSLASRQTTCNLS